MTMPPDGMIMRLGGLSLMTFGIISDHGIGVIASTGFLFIIAGVIVDRLDEILKKQDAFVLPKSVNLVDAEKEKVMGSLDCVDSNSELLKKQFIKGMEFSIKELREEATSFDNSKQKISSELDDLLKEVRALSEEDEKFNLEFEKKALSLVDKLWILKGVT